MTLKRMAAVGLVFASAATADAQPVTARGTSDAPAAALRGPIVDVTRLPLSLERIGRELRQSTVTEERDGLNIRYTVEVFGQAPPLVIFTREDNLVVGPVPYGAPTHRDIINHITPQEYRAPAADIGALLRWLADRAAK